MSVRSITHAPASPASVVLSVDAPSISLIVACGSARPWKRTVSIGNCAPFAGAVTFGGSGLRVSSVNCRVASGPKLPAASFARTRNVCAPSCRPP